MADDLYAQWQATSTVQKKEKKKPHYSFFPEVLSLPYVRLSFTAEIQQYAT